MISTDSQLDFTGQDIYVGLDIGQKSWKTCILTKDFEHKTFTQPPNVEALVGYLHRQFPGARYHSVYEAGYFGFWIHDELQSRGVDNLVVTSVSCSHRMWIRCGGGGGGGGTKWFGRSCNCPIILTIFSIFSIAQIRVPPNLARASRHSSSVIPFSLHLSIAER